ncbi:MAG: alpha-amylase family glycosyl hydrolase, partial [Verrucomicrobiota bacterium]
TYSGGSPETTYLFGSDEATHTTTSEAGAQAAPFSIRNRPGWVLHANNRTVAGNDLQVRLKTGYIGTSGALNTRWATAGALYYRLDPTGTDATAPGGALGVADAGSTAIALQYDGVEGDGSGNGNAAWWRGTMSNALAGLPIGGKVRYKIGLWNPATNDEKFADHQAGTDNALFTYQNGTIGDPVLTVNGQNGNYTSTHLFVDEMAGDAQPLAVTFSPGQANVITVELFTNLNRRDRAQLDANGDGIEDGILPPDGNTVVVGDNNYFTAYTMNNAGAGNYSLTLNAQKTGAYRLTARWKVQGDPAWHWYTTAGRRDHAIVVSPVDARNISLYELNVLTVESSDNTPADSSDDFANRSTFEDLYNAPNAPHNTSNRWDLDYLKNLGCNWLWFQPIHPIGVEGETDYPGSPYAVKNFFEVNPLMSVGNTREAAMLAFQGLVSAAYNKGVKVMLDAPFNHTAPDAEIASAGVSLFGGAATSEIRNIEAKFYSQSGNYGARASSAANLAVAPDRGDFGKWNDVRDVFFGNYSALVSLNPQDNGNFTNEGDFFDFNGSNFDGVTRNVWKYFAGYPLFWLDQTGVPEGSSGATQTAHGISGLRADFGQGLPPQLWEYIINKTRTRKWNFVFMSESLDGGAVTYRSNRHFDLLNENIVFPLASASEPTHYRSIFETRRNAYGQGLVLLNNMSHDEESYTDPFQALVRFAVVNTVDGAPLVFSGQELGISRTFGYQKYETNFGKQIAQFKQFNSMMPAWSDTNYGNDQLYPVYAGIGQARQFSRALRSSNRYFLDQVLGGPHGKIYATAKFETLNAAPSAADVVFAFANTDRDWSGSGSFNVNQDTDNNGVNDYGIKPGRYYNVRNIAAYTAIRPNRRDIWQWRVAPYAESDVPAPRLGTDILANGIYVAMNRVPQTDASWTSAPYEAQYLKLYDVTPPPAPTAPANPSLHASVIGHDVTFSWSPASDPDGGVNGYHLQLGTSSGGSDLFDSGVAATSQTVTVAYGTVVYAHVQQINNAGIYGPYSPVSAPVVALDPAADADGDGQSNAAEEVAGTDPLLSSSTFKTTGITSAGNDRVISATTVPGKVYQLETSLTLQPPWSPVGDPVSATAITTSFTHLGGTAGGRRFYRVRVVP